MLAATGRRCARPPREPCLKRPLCHTLCGAGGDLGLADAAFWEAAEAFEALLAREPRNVRALGNYGAPACSKF